MGLSKDVDAVLANSGRGPRGHSSRRHPATCKASRLMASWVAGARRAGAHRRSAVARQQEVDTFTLGLTANGTGAGGRNALAVEAIVESALKDGGRAWSTTRSTAASTRGRSGDGRGDGTTVFAAVVTAEQAVAWGRRGIAQRSSAAGGGGEGDPRALRRGEPGVPARLREERADFQQSVTSWSCTPCISMPDVALVPATPAPMAYERVA